MEIYPEIQAHLMLLSALWGAILGVAWEILSVLLGKVRFRGAHRILRFFADLSFVTVACFGVIILCYYFNFGEFRAFCVLGLLASFFCIRAVLGRAVRAMAELILRACIGIIRAIVRPFAKIYKYLVNILEKFIHYIRRGIAKITLLVYNVYCKKLIVKRSCKGFFDDV